jgi:HAD superfamily hydrolase (TIGR01549 family)
LYAEESDPANNAFAADAQRTLHALRSGGIRIAIVSDIHFDLRPAFTAAGLDDCIDSYLLSYEHGVQKPDAEIFHIALRDLAVAPAEALMVGDRATHDGAAVTAAIPTLLLPTLLDPADERLHLVLSLCGTTAAAD